VSNHGRIVISCFLAAMGCMIFMAWFIELLFFKFLNWELPNSNLSCFGSFRCLGAFLWELGYFFFFVLFYCLGSGFLYSQCQKFLLNNNPDE